MRGLGIVCDCDQCIADFCGGFEKEFNVSYQDLTSEEITQKVTDLKYNYKFWENLPKLNDLDFEPLAYCTARINSKYTTKKWLKKNNFPNSPVYQVMGYKLSKVSQLKRIPLKDNEIKIFIDDSWKNVSDALNAGIPAFLYNTPYNQDIDTPLRIMDLKFKTICHAYRKFYF